MIYIYGFGLERFKPETVRDFIWTQGAWGPLLFVLGNAARPLVFFPAIVLGVAGGLAFGPLWGTLYLIAGTLLGAALCFWAARALGCGGLLQAFSRWIGPDTIERLATRRTFRTVLVLRLVPVLPWDAVSFIAGVSNMRFWPYLAATAAGCIPGAVAFSMLGDALGRSLPQALWATAASLLILCLPAAYGWVTQRRQYRPHN
ncbi:MAG TPA: VTT domain-containing protein [Selenomonadales bacterium]|nr:VTT domain-containing protein [Selenomonadales bacterium]